MEELRKYKALYEMLANGGAMNVRARLCPDDRWDEYEVLKLWAKYGNIYYSTYSWNNCCLTRENSKGRRNAAYLYDQINYDRNLF